MARERTRALRQRVYMALEQGPVGERLAVFTDRALMALIIVNLIAVALESVPDIGARYTLAFDVIEYFSLVVFTIEYGLRLWGAVEHGPHPQSTNGMTQRT